MTITNGYCTLAELKSALQKPTTDTVNDTWFERCIESASRLIDQRTGRVFYSISLNGEILDIYNPNDNGIMVDGSGSRLLFPSPIIVVTSIYEDNILLTENTDFYLYKNQGLIERDGYWTSNRKGTDTGIKLTLSYGYSSIPADIKGLCIQLAKIFTGVATRIVTDGSGGAMSFTLDSVPRWIVNEIDKHRRSYV
jgi:hypothetical protein